MHDFDELTAFDAVMESGNLTRSATRLGLSKSTLSRRISQLESRLGYPLLRRQSNRLLPTEAGELFHGYCQRMLELAQQSQAALEALHHEISGELVVDVHVALTRPWMTQVLHAFMARHRRLDVTLKTHERFHASPESSAIHVTLGAVIDETLRCEQLTLLRRGIYAHPDYLARHGRPQQPDELLEHHWIDLLGDAAGGLPLRHRDGAQFLLQPPRSRLRLDQPMLQADAIARGQGLGIMPCWLAERRERAHPGELEACLPEWRLPTLPVNLLYAHGHQAGKVSAMLDFLRRHLPPEWDASSSPSSVAS